jgi:hypothetical protein
MGLPQFLRKQIQRLYDQDLLDDADCVNLFWAAFCAGRDLPNPEIKSLVCALKFGVKKRYGYRRQSRCPPLEFSNESLSQKTTSRFVALQKGKDGVYEWVGEPTLIQNRYLGKYEVLRTARIAREVSLAKAHEEVVKLQQVVYQSRCFPPRLREMVFLRDEYRCTKCGRHRDELVRFGLHLECDHILAWEDGGETKYSNGQTLCSECNKGKHAAKKYAATVLSLWASKPAPP